MYNVVLIKGSMRNGSYTGKALSLVEAELRESSVAVQNIDPLDFNLKMPGEEGKNDGALRLQQIVKDADAVILATPEYHGAPSSLTKLVIENLGFPSALAGKPVGLLGVASGQIGAVKSIEMLRSICGHVGALVLPGSVSVANVRNVFDESGNCLIPGIEKRIRNLGSSIVKYLQSHLCPSRAFEEIVRNSKEKK